MEEVFGARLSPLKQEPCKRKCEELPEQQNVDDKKKRCRTQPPLEPASYVVDNSWMLLFVEQAAEPADADALRHFLSAKERFRNRNEMSFGSFWKNRFAPARMKRGRKMHYEIDGALAELVAKFQRRFACLEQLSCFLVEEHFFDSSARRGGAIRAEGDAKYPETLAIVLFFIGQQRRVSIRTPNSPHVFLTRHNSAIVMHGQNFLDGCERQVAPLEFEETIETHSMLTFRFKLDESPLCK